MCRTAVDHPDDGAVEFQFVRGKADIMGIIIRKVGHVHRTGIGATHFLGREGQAAQHQYQECKEIIFHTLRICEMEKRGCLITQD